MTEQQPLNVIRCLSGIIAGAAVVFGLAAAYIATFPMAFLPSGYPVWVAKQQMLHTCDLGEVMQFGDSQLEADIENTARHLHDGASGARQVWG